MLTYDEIRKNEEIKVYITEADKTLIDLGYTEHSYAHVGIVSKRCEYILTTLGYDSHTVELGKIAGYLHDIGNVVNRQDHSQSGAIMAFRILDKLGMAAIDIAKIVTAIGNHDEGTGVPVSPIAAALIIADKTDVRRSRVRNSDISTFDIHDRVNYSVEETSVTVSEDKSTLTLSLRIDTSISPIMDYFEIFLERMLLCRKACERLDMTFCLVINEQKII